MPTVEQVPLDSRSQLSIPVRVTPASVCMRVTIECELPAPGTRGRQVRMFGTRVQWARVPRSVTECICRVLRNDQAAAVPRDRGVGCGLGARPKEVVVKALGVGRAKKGR
jgi:hypothetical protein